MGAKIYKARINEEGNLHVVPDITVKRLRKDGQIKLTRPGSKKGKSNEVYPIKDRSKIEEIKAFLMGKVDEADNSISAKIAARNYVLFVVGINVGLRISDLLNLKYSDILNQDGTYKEGIKLQPKKTRNSGKYVTLYYNQSIMDAVSWYIKHFDMDYDMNDFIFFSSQRKRRAICTKTAETLMKHIAKECDIKFNLGTHSLRKTYGYWYHEVAEDKVNALNDLMEAFNHSSQKVTLRYIGLGDERRKETINNLNL